MPLSRHICRLAGVAGLALVLLAVVGTIRPAERAAAQTGGLPAATWTIDANGSVGELVITSVDGDGRVHGTVFDNELFGLWDPAVNRILFVRMPDRGNPETFQVYTGYLFTTPPNPGAGDNFTLTLAGSFEKFNAPAATSVRGWYAQLEQNH